MYLDISHTKLIWAILNFEKCWAGIPMLLIECYIVIIQRNIFNTFDFIYV